MKRPKERVQTHVVIECLAASASFRFTRGAHRYLRADLCGGLPKARKMRLVMEMKKANRLSFTNSSYHLLLSR